MTLTAEETITKIVTKLRRRWPDKITPIKIEWARRRLGEIRRLNVSQKSDSDGPSKTYSYNTEKFPPMQLASSPNTELDLRRLSLAESLLWKIGKWNAYKKFVADYVPDQIDPADFQSKPVFGSFARYLRDPIENPIIDQHSARALWAISDTCWDYEADPFKHFLASKPREPEDKEQKRMWSDDQIVWKTNAGGASSEYCIELYKIEIERASAHANAAQIDQLLMPLGQALKDFSERHNDNYDYRSFARICGREEKAWRRFRKANCPNPK